MVLRSSRGKKRIKNGPKLDKNFTKTVTWSFSDTFWTYFWWILLRNNTSFHLRLITLICDHFDEFYKQKTDQKRAEKSSKTIKNHPKSVISSHMHTKYGHNMASYGLFNHNLYNSYLQKSKIFSIRITNKWRNQPQN